MALTRCLLVPALLAFACGAPQPPRKNVDARPPAVASAATSAGSQRDGGSRLAPEDCELREAMPIEGHSPLPGLTVYPQAGAGAHSWHLAKDHALLLPHSDTNPPANPAVLVPLRGGPARAIPIRRLERFERYLIRGLELVGDVRQPGIMLLARDDDPCYSVGLHAFDPNDFRRLFHHSEGAAWPRYDAFAPAVGRLSGDRFLLRTLDRTGDPEATLLLFDLASGKPLWRRRAPNGPIAFGGGRILLGHDALYELAPADGRPTRLFPVTPVPPQAMSASSSHATFLVPSDVKRPEEWTCPLYDDDGRDRCTYDLFSVDRSGAARLMVTVPGPQDAAQILSDSDDVFVALQRTIDGIGHSVIAAFDSASGRERWYARPVPCGGSQRAYLETEGPALYAGTCDGVLRRLDRKTGAVTGEFGIGWDGDFAISNGVIVFMADGLALLDSGALSSPEREVLVRGKVTIAPDVGMKFPVRVRVGPKLVRTDGSGRFRATVRGRGLLTANVALSWKELTEWSSNSASFGFDRPEHELSLEIRPSG